MLDIKFIRNNLDTVEKGCEKKGIKIDINYLLRLDEERINQLQLLENIRAEKNEGSRKIAREKIKNKKKDLISEMQKIAKKEERIQKRFDELEKEFKQIMNKIPNLPLSNVPQGKDEKENVVLREVGRKPNFSFEPRSYLEIAEKLDLIDVKRAANVSGTRFGYLRKEAALLQLSLINFTFDYLTKKAFIPIIPPVMIRSEMMEGTGHLSEKDEQEKYFLEKDNLYLVGSAEQSIVSMHTDEVFKEKDLPLRYLGYSSCFRREAGSYGKDTKGIFRVHQFDKIEMVSFIQPEQSEKEHQFLLSLQEELMQILKIPYRVIHICTGDLGFPAAAAYDIEAWLPSEKRYRETHTTFNDTDFQARRLNIRYRFSKNNELNFVHVLNGTAFAIGRIIIAIIENYQKENGTISIPEPLHKYLSFKEINLKKH
jgi:seryl-tRNA synthetase